MKNKDNVTYLAIFTKEDDEYNIEIISGLKVNDNLVVKGFETLKEDAKVKIQK